MISDYSTVYYNNFGISLQTICRTDNIITIHLVFKSLCLSVVYDQLIYLKESIIYQVKNSCDCRTCNSTSDQCILLHPLSKNVGITLNKKEISQVYGLINGTIFSIQLSDCLRINNIV